METIIIYSVYIANLILNIYSSIFYLVAAISLDSLIKERTPTNDQVPVIRKIYVKHKNRIGNSCDLMDNYSQMVIEYL